MDNSEVKLFFENTDQYLLRNPELALRRKIVKAFLESENCGQILDLGCGDGSISIEFLKLDSKVTFVDFSSEMLSKLKQSIAPSLLPFSSFQQKDIIKDDIIGEYDVVLCLGVLAHITSPEQVIRKVNTLLKPNGLFVIQFSDDESFIGRIFNWLLNSKLGSRTRGYKLTKISYSKIDKCIKNMGMTLECQSAFMGKIPYFHRKLPIFTGWYQEKTVNARWLSFFNSERILKYRKS